MMSRFTRASRARRQSSRICDAQSSGAKWGRAGLGRAAARADPAKALDRFSMELSLRRGETVRVTARLYSRYRSGPIGKRAVRSREDPYQRGIRARQLGGAFPD